MLTYSKIVAREFECDVLVVGGDTAAAIAVAENIKPEEVCIKKLQNTLIAQGAVIKD